MFVIYSVVSHFLTLDFGIIWSALSSFVICSLERNEEKSKKSIARPVNNDNFRKFLINSCEERERWGPRHEESQARRNLICNVDFFFTSRFQVTIWCERAEKRTKLMRARLQFLPTNRGGSRDYNYPVILRYFESSIIVISAGSELTERHVARRKRQHNAEQTKKELSVVHSSFFPLFRGDHFVGLKHIPCEATVVPEDITAINTHSTVRGSAQLFLRAFALELSFLFSFNQPPSHRSIGYARYTNSFFFNILFPFQLTR